DALRAGDVLDGDRHTGQAWEHLTGGAAGVDVRGGGEGAVGVHLEERVEHRVQRGDPVQVRLGELHGGEVPGGEAVGHLRRGEVGEVGSGRHTAAHSSSRMRGTLNRSSSASGAFASACSAVRLGRTSSGRVTLVSGNGCDIGGTSAAATSLTWPTQSTIWSS